MRNDHRIYLIECIPNGKRYIGSATFFTQRLSRHKKDLRSGRHANANLQASWSKYGEKSFRFIELECVLEKQWLVGEEQRWIDEEKPEFNVCKTAGSPLGVKHSAETRLRRSRILKEYWSTHPHLKLSEERRQQISERQRGSKRTFSAQHRARLAASKVGTTLPPEVRRKIGTANRGKTRTFTPEHCAAIKAAWAIRKAIH